MANMFLLCHLYQSDINEKIFTPVFSVLASFFLCLTGRKNSGQRLKSRRNLCDAIALAGPLGAIKIVFFKKGNPNNE
jgi:hypothetical protein